MSSATISKGNISNCALNLNVATRACLFFSCLASALSCQVNRMIADADVSGDGRVDYSEFAHLWKTFLMQKHQKPVAGRLQQVKRQAPLPRSQRTVPVVR